jgi:hypothetical protein
VFVKLPPRISTNPHRLAHSGKDTSRRVLDGTEQRSAGDSGLARFGMVNPFLPERLTPGVKFLYGSEFGL